MTSNALKMDDSLFDIQTNRTRWLTIDEAAVFLKVSKWVLYQHKKYGIPATKKFGKLRFDQDELELWFEGVDSLTKD